MRSKHTTRQSVENRDAPTDDGDWNELSRRLSRSSERPRRRWGWLLIFGLVLLGACVFFLPNIVSQTGLKDVVLERLTRGYPMRLSIARLHLGWFSPVMVSDLSLRDERGESLLEVSGIESEKTLFSLATDWKHLGRIRIVRPVVQVDLEGDRSNWESFLEALPRNESAAPTPLVDVAILVENGRIEVHDGLNRHEWQLDVTKLSALLPMLSGRPQEARFEGSLLANKQPAGQLRAELVWGPDVSPEGLENNASPASENSSSFASGKLDLHAVDTPLDVCELALRRFIPNLVISGVATCDAQYEWSDHFASHRAVFRKLEVQDALFRAPAWLGQDELQSRTVTGAGEVAFTASAFKFDQLKVDADMLRLEADGALTLAGLSDSASWERWLSQDAQLRGEFDLAAIARMLPGTLHLKEGTQIDNGKCGIAFRSRLEQGQRRWEAMLQTDELSGSAGGKAIRWQQPIQLELKASQSARGIVVESLSGEASFLKLNAQGELREGSLTAKANLDQFLREMGQFVDLGGLRMAGQMSADLNWKPAPGDLLAATGRAHIEKFELVAGSLMPWREDQLTLSTNLIGELSLTGLEQLRNGELSVEAGKDQLRIKLLEPMTSFSATGPWRLSGQLAGELSTWLPRLQPLVALPGWDLQGTIDTRVTASAVNEQIQLPELKIQLAGLKVAGPGLQINESRVEVDGTGTWDQRAQTLSADTVTLASSALALRAENVRLRTGGDGFAVAGDAGFRADLARLSNWLGDPRVGASTRFSGMANGQLRVTYNDGISQATVSGDIADLVVATRTTSDAGPGTPARPGTGTAVRTAIQDGGWKAAWEEPQLKLSGLVRYDAPQAQLQLSKFDIASKAINVNASGTVADVTNRCELDLTGHFEYDWQKVGALLRPYTGQLLWIDGEESRDFLVRGPLFAASVVSASGSIRTASSKSATPPPVVPEDLLAATKLGWKSANYGGFEIGRGELDARLERGVLRLGPLNVQISGGELNLDPEILLNASPMMITAKPGRIAERVQITPQMCQGWLKYITPILADATIAKGHFSLDLDEARLPADNPALGTIRGRLTIHEARIGPGPMSKELIWLASQVKNLAQRRPLDPNLQVSEEWLDVPEQRIDFEVLQGRIHNKGIAFHVKDVDIRTRGSVGFDQTVILNAEVPIKDEWVANQRYLSALQGQALQVPISGLITKPKLDSRALTEISKQVVTGAASKLLEDELSRGLDRLLRPKK